METEEKGKGPRGRSKPDQTNNTKRKKPRVWKRMPLPRLLLLRAVVAGDPESLGRCYRETKFKALADLPGLLGHPCATPRVYSGDGESEAFIEGLISEIDEATATAVGIRSDPVTRAADALSDRLGFDEVERDILALVLLLSAHECLAEVLRHSGADSFLPACRLLSRMLGYTEARMRRVMSPRGTLARIGFIDPSGRHCGVTSLLEPVPRLVDGLHAPEGMLDGFFMATKPAALTVGDYPHLEAEISMATRYLKGALAQHSRGVNVLLHGPPGTGKTELARLLVAECGVAAYDVVVSDFDDDGKDGRQRMASYLVCQRALGANGKAIVVFDEAEDVFPAQRFPFFGFGSARSLEKGWICRELEENPLPAIWIANTVGHIDPAHLRRFDLVVEVPVPPQEVRQRIAEKHLEKVDVDPRLLAELSRCEDLAPSDIERAAKVVTVSATTDTAERSRTIRKVLESSLAVRGLRGPSPSSVQLETSYDLTLVNASCDLERLVASLGVRPTGTLCLYGPPGTGKTAFVKHAAERLGLNVAAHRGSDLLSMWVGQTEARIAQMFRTARPGRDLVFLDEADSFLRRRDLAQRSWEVTQVNELLTQMESFDGLFVCATNLLDDLDEAAFRRFGLKIRFDHLDADRRFRFACSELAALGITMTDAEAIDFHRRLDALDHLSLGDFAAVRKRFRLVAPPATAAAYTDALAEERSFKKEARVRHVGFTS